MSRVVLLSIMAFLVLFPEVSWAQSDVLQIIEKATADETLAPELRVLLTLTVLSFVPAALIAMTAFTRIVIVLSLLRQALGLMQTPPNIVIITLAFFLTWFAMQPVFSEAKELALKPYLSDEITFVEAVEKGFEPFRSFMIQQTREEDFAAVLNMASAQPPAEAKDIELSHLIPAFMLSELKTAFQIAFVIFIPFLLIDLIVASTLMALGMIMVPPISIALPIKIMLFILVDGWSLVTQSLMASIMT
ncbi:flagellar type III secretion system pore protein FliP [Paraneptunicella aestuarii]|uniref:flagellar type III secretion system pore protein FliP n=1 Tax=Paraneptunicella aestuarii TaxID=2831148 RepID=UPI001E557997|nr:flagellar type III secretion system pore protein FliP [Paraneptunicella aestuarii]UAA37581.1 flagellar type III secretion system pore protein FliP [Paraneptunicella aestuarii]